jgi:DNA-binding IclR family transcriptional regulator
VVALGIPVSDQVVVVERIWHPAAPLSSILDIGVRLPLSHSAAGRAFLAALDDAEVLDLIGSTSVKEIGPRLATVRQSGISFSNNEIQPGIGAAAAAILDDDGHPVATLIVAGARLESELNPDSPLAHQILRIAATMSRTLAKATV